jgi:hypothetical protein
MKQTIFGTDRATCQRNLRVNILLCILVFCAIVVLHAVCTAIRTELNHTYMLIANIGTDVIGGSFLIARLSMCVFPQKKLLQLYDRANQDADGQVLGISDTVIHYIGVDCYEVLLSDRRLFLPADTMALTVGQHYRFRLKGNLIVEVRGDE